MCPSRKDSGHRPGGCLVYFEPRAAYYRHPIWLKSKNAKVYQFPQEKTGFSCKNTRKVQSLANTILSYRFPNVKMIFHQIPVKTISFPLLSNFCTDYTNFCNMIVCSDHFVSTLYYMQEKGIPVIGVQNLMSLEELKEKLLHCNS